MKKIIIVCLLTISAALAFGDAELDMYKFLYESSQVNSEQLGILQNMVEAKISGAGDFYAEALGRLMSRYSNVRTASVTERNAASEQARILANFLGNEKYTAAAPDIWRIYEEFPDTEGLLKAEALMALGKMQAAPFFPQVLGVLNGLNLRPSQDRLNGERVAYGAIIALEKFQNPEAALPLYNAYKGWYSDRIKNQAGKSLDVISTTLTPYITNIIRNPGYDYPTKLVALQTMEKSKSSNDAKASIAVIAFAQGWTSVAAAPALQTTLATMRKTSIDMIKSYGTTDPTVYPMLDRSYSDAQTAEDEKFKTVDALAALATDQSAQLLSKYLTDLNVKRQRGNIAQADERMVRTIIPALGATKQPAGRSALSAVVNIKDWPSAVQTLAQTALRQIPAN